MNSLLEAVKILGFQTALTADAGRVAIQEQRSGSVVTWMEKVSDAQYGMSSEFAMPR